MIDMPAFGVRADAFMEQDLTTLVNPASRVVLKEALVAMQREAWNARGAADATAVDERIGEKGWIVMEPYRSQIRDVISALDRR